MGYEPFQCAKMRVREKYQSCLQARDFRDHLATDGSLLGIAGKCEACGWPMVQVDQDEEMGPMHGMYGWLEAGLEVQRPIKRAELTAFSCLLTKGMGPTKVHAENKGIFLMGRGKEK